jgi:gamma-glutamylcyclotransferase (GGCT)/AIG2-like uncharacterized protein YtfP
LGQALPAARRIPSLGSSGEFSTGHRHCHPLADTRTHNTIELSENAMIRPEGDWDLVYGELMTFANPGFDLPSIDRLEAFDPNGRCVYTRVLVAVESNDLIRPAWLYHYNLGHNLARIASGQWYPAK